MKPEKYLDLTEFLVKPGSKVSLKSYKTEYKGNELNKESGEELLKAGIEKLSDLQDKLYADDTYNMLIIIQAMDTAGKDGAVKHVMSGLNPTGVKVKSFKTPSATELDHDYLWRHSIALPARGEIGIFNRSHYENVLITKVHPELILKEHLPSINSVEQITEEFWKKRYEQIKRFEKNLAENGTIILKFFLHLSKKEQKKRIISRIDNHHKNWKVSSTDVQERQFWNDYQKAYEEAIENTSTAYAPWFIIPAEPKWYSRLVIAAIIYAQFEELHLKYPEVNEDRKAELQKMKEELLNEKD